MLGYSALITQEMIATMKLPVGNNTPRPTVAYNVNLNWAAQGNFDLGFDRFENLDRTWVLAIKESMPVETMNNIIKCIRIRMNKLGIDYTDNTEMNFTTQSYHYAVKFNTDGDEGLFLFHHTEILTIERGTIWY